MSQSLAVTLEEAPPAPPLRKGYPLLAWLVILAVVGFILWRSSKADPREQENYDLLNMRTQSRSLLGIAQLMKKLAPDANGGSKFYDDARESLDRGTYAQRLRFVVVAGELKGPKEARDCLSQLNERYRAVRGEPSTEDAETAQILESLYSLRIKKPKTTPDLSEDDRRELRQRLGWFGDLALTPAGDDDVEARAAVLAPATRTIWANLGFCVIGLCAAGLGLILLVTLFVLWLMGLLRGGLTCASAYGGVYAETFAWYMVLFMALSFAARFLLQHVSLQGGTLALSGLVALASLSALVWPVLRGIPWKQVRQDIGWQMGRRPWLEPFFGVACYALALPMLLVGVLLVVGMTSLRDRLGFGPEEFAPSGTPGHPIVFSLARGQWWMWLQVLFVAAVVAPIVEETMFRGVLYRHLREASRGWRPALSVLVSALLVSFVFAVIHPQGYLGVPVLMALALAFALMREWRGTLLPSMIAHGINNAIVTVLMLVVMS